jgi:hypothetical protein
MGTHALPSSKNKNITLAEIAIDKMQLAGKKEPD